MGHGIKQREQDEIICLTSSAFAYHGLIYSIARSDDTLVN